MSRPLHWYVSADEDSRRWRGFAFRPGDIVVSTRSKTGTTWLQMICLLLVHRSAELPAPLSELSPWLDHTTEPCAAVLARLAARPGRRVIKTHTPLDGVPIDSQAHYLVCTRHPLDMAISLYHHRHNLDRARLAELTGSPAFAEPMAPDSGPRDWVMRWVRQDCDPQEYTDSLPGVMWHLSDAWRRRDEPNVTLVRYEDLCADLAAQMRRIAGRLDCPVPELVWPRVVQAATFERMRGDAARSVPDSAGILKDATAFFRRGRSGAAAELLSDAEIAEYHARAAQLAEPELLAWLHG